MNAEKASSEGSEDHNEPSEQPHSTKRKQDEDNVENVENVNKKRKNVPPLRDLIEQGCEDMSLMEQAYQEYDPDKDEQREDLPVLHLFLTVRADEPDLFLFLIEKFPQDLRIAMRNGGLPIHRYLNMHCEIGVLPDTDIVRAMMEQYPESCLIKSSPDAYSDSPLEEAFLYGLDVAEIIYRALSRIKEDFFPHRDGYFSIPEQTCDAEPVVVNEAIARLFATILPYLKSLTCYAQQWTVQGWVTLFEGVAQAVPTRNGRFEKLCMEYFPSGFIRDNSMVQQAFTQGIAGLKKLQCGNFNGENHFSAFFDAMSSVELPATMMLELKGNEVQHVAELQQFLGRLAPIRVVLSHMIFPDEPQAGVVNEEGNNNPANSRIERLHILFCQGPSASQRRLMRGIAQLPRLQGLQLLWSHTDMDDGDQRSDATEALITLLEQESPVRVIFVTTINLKRIYEAMVRTNNSTLHELNGPYKTSDDEYHYVQIQYITLLNKYGRGRLRQQYDQATLQDLVQLLADANQSSELLQIQLANVCFGLLREVPHLWSSATLGS